MHMHCIGFWSPTFTKLFVREDTYCCYYYSQQLGQMQFDLCGTNGGSSCSMSVSLEPRISFEDIRWPHRAPPSIITIWRNLSNNFYLSQSAHFYLTFLLIFVDMR